MSASVVSRASGDFSLYDSYMQERYVGILTRIFQNTLLQISTLAASCITFAVCLLKNPFYSLTVSVPLSIGSIAMLGIVIWMRRHQLWQRIALSVISLANQCGCFPWWHQIDSQRVVSALPFYEQMPQFFKEFPQRKIAVITVTKELETNIPNVMKPEDWRHYGIPHIAFHVFDLHAPSQVQIKKAVAWSSSHRLAGRTVVWHCNAGVGRSATMLVCDVLHQMVLDKKVPPELPSAEVVDLQIKKLEEIRKHTKIVEVQRRAIITFLEDLRDKGQ